MTHELSDANVGDRLVLEMSIKAVSEAMAVLALSVNSARLAIVGKPLADARTDTTKLIPFEVWEEAPSAMRFCALDVFNKAEFE